MGGICHSRWSHQHFKQLRVQYLADTTTDLDGAGFEPAVIGPQAISSELQSPCGTFWAVSKTESNSHGIKDANA